MRRILLIAVCAFLSCGPALRGPGSFSDRLSRAQNAYLADGDQDRAQSELEAALTIEPTSPEAHFLLADLLDVTGRPAQALDHYLRVLEETHLSGDGQDEAVAAAMGVVAIRNRVEAFNDIFNTFWNERSNRPDKLPPEALFQLRNLTFGIALKSDDADASAEFLEGTGCLTNWMTAGSFGPFVWETFDDERLRNEMTDPLRPWPGSVDLGPGRGRSAVRRARAKTCTISTGDRTNSTEGVSWSRTTISIVKPETVLFRLETTSAARVFVGKDLVFSRDPRVSWPSMVHWFGADLPAGTTDIVVELADPGYARTFSLVATTRDGTSLATGHGADLPPSGGRAVAAPGVSPQHKPQSPSSALALLRAAVWWEDRDLAGDLLSWLTARGFGESPVVLTLRAQAVKIDPSLPGEVAFELSRNLMIEALGKEPRMIEARDQIAITEASDGRDVEAVDIIREGIALCPDEPTLFGRLAELAVGLGWYSETLYAVNEMDRLMPSSCKTLGWRLFLARQLNRFDEARELAKAQRSCNSTAAGLAEELGRSGRYELSAQEYERIAGLRPDSVLFNKELGSAHLASADLEGFTVVISRVLDLDPADILSRLSLADALIALGRKDDARAVLVKGLAILPGPHPVINNAIDTLDSRKPYAQMRIDGLAVIDEYKKNDVEYNTAAVWVLDRAVHLVGRSGARTEIVHNIAHLKTDEAVEEHGEMSLPDGAILLTARTIKKDGRILEPEDIAGKSTISLPDLEPGDFIEQEYVAFALTSPVFLGGFETGRFYFQDFNTAFHRSEVMVVAPRSMEIQADPRGDCPAVEIRQDGDAKVWIWRTREKLPRGREPLAPVASEYLPSIKVSAGGTQQSLCSRFNDMIAGLERPADPIDEALSNALDGISRDDVTAVKTALYHWVMEHIQNESDLFEQAGHIIGRRSGSRVRAFLALLHAAGIEGRLALVKQAGEDDTVSDVPDMGIMSRSAVLIGDDEWVNLDEEGSKYGYLPPEIRRRPALLPDSCEMVKTTDGAVGADGRSIDARFAMSADGSLEGHVVEDLTGHLAASWRTRIRQIPAAELEQRFQESYLADTVSRAELTSLSFENLDSPQSPLVLKYSFAVDRFARRGTGGLEVKLPFESSLQKSMGALPTRTTAVVMASHDAKIVNISFTTPKGTRISAVTGPNEAQGPWGVIRRKTSVDGNTLKVRVESTFDAIRVEPPEYPEFLEYSQLHDRVSKIEFTVLPR